MPVRRDIETALALAEAETGVRGGKRSIPLCFEPTARKKARLWTEDEERFIRENHGRMNDEQIGQHLGRTKISVKLHREREMHVASISKSPEILTAEQVANGIGIDSKSVHLLIDTGRMSGRRLPSARVMRVVDRLALMKWILDPDHWCYFKPERVGMLALRGKRGIGENYDFVFWENARDLVTKARRRWKDAWLTPGQVVMTLKINPKATCRRKDYDRIPGVRYVNKAILKANLKATRWGNWWVKKSDLPERGRTINYIGEIVRIKKWKRRSSL